MTMLRLAAVAALLPAALARADAFDWNNSAGGAFESPTNWSPTIPGAGPAAADTARFTLPNPYGVTFSSNPTTAQLQLTAGSVGFSSASNATYRVNDATSISNTFSLSSMTLSSDVVALGGAMTLNSNAHLIASRNDLTVPALSISATSVLTIAGGATLQAGSGQPATPIYIGNTRVDLAGEIQAPTAGEGVIFGLLNLMAPAGDTAILNAQRLTIAQGGSVEVSGDALLRSNAQFQNFGSIDVAANAHLATQSDSVLGFSNSVIRAFAGSRFDASGIMVSQGSFLVMGGAALHFAEGYANLPSTGSISSVFRFEGGGTSHIYRGVGGTFQNDSEVVIQVNPNLPPTVVYFHTPFINNNLVNNPAPSKIYFEGFLSGSGTLAGGGDFFVQANMSPGPSTGSGLVNVFGKLTFGPEAELYMELEGRTRGSQYDAINITGDLNLNGTLRLVPIFGFKPVAGDSFDLLDFTSISGSFHDVILPPITGARWDTSDLYTTGVVRLVAVPEPGILLGWGALAFLVGRRKRR